MLLLLTISPLLSLSPLVLMAIRAPTRPIRSDGRMDLQLVELPNLVGVGHGSTRRLG